MDLTPYLIGSFQFENLVRNRIPFTLLNLGASLDDLFPSFHQGHLTSVSVAVSPEQALPRVRELRLPAEGAIVLVCNDGEASISLIPRLLDMGYTNVFAVRGGSQTLQEELKN